MAVLSFLLIISLFITQIQAADISLEYVSDSEFFDSNSLFIDPNIIGNKTIISSNGTFTSAHEVAEDQSSININTDVYNIYCDGFTDNMSITIMYDEIGTYNGETVGCKFTIYDIVFSQGTNSYSYPVFNVKTNLYYGITANNVLSASFSAEFFLVSNPDSIIDVSGAYVSFGSVSKNEMITALDTVTNVYVSSDTDITTFDIDGVTYYSTKSSGASSDYVDTVGSSTFNKATVTLKFENSLTFGIAITKDSRSMWFTMSTSALGLTQPADPIKTVDGQAAVIDKAVGDVITYRVAQTVHTMGENTLECYTSLVISDALPSEVTYSSSNPAYLTDASGNVISNAGTVSYDSSTNTVKFTFSSSYLSSTMAYEGETYVLVIPCTINSNAAAGSTFTNYATVNFDDYPTITSNEVTVTMLGYEISTSVSHGTITETETNIDQGDNRTIYYSPESGYQIDSVTVDGVEVDIKKYPTSYTFSNISDDHTINVTFIPYWKITTSVTNGTISDDVTEGITGEDYTIEYSPDKGYLIDTVVVDGKEVDVTEYPSSYTFEDLDADHTITVTYAEPKASKEVYLSSSEFSSNYTSGQSIEGYVLIPGDVVEYRISYSNPTSVERTIVITDTLPSEVKPTSATNSGSISGQTVTWTITAPAYNSGTVSVYAEVVDSGEFTNTASVTFKKLSGSTTEKDVTIKDTVTTSAMDDPVKWVANEDGEDVSDQVISAGDTLTYYIQFTNPSSSTKTFTVTDVVPSGTTLVSGSISNGGTYKNGTITWTGLSLAGGATKTVSFSVTVDEPSEELTQIPNQATVGVDNVEINSVATASPNDDDGYTWVYVLDDPVKVAMDGNGNNLSDNQTIVNTGTSVEYEITVSNPAKTAKVFTITDPLPEYVSFASCDNSGVYNESTHTVTWNITVGAGESATVSVVTTVNYGSQGACFENVATVTVDSTTTETSPASIAVLTNPEKSVTLNGEDANNEPVSVGDTLVYGINYYNPSEYMKTFTITDYLPDEVTFVSADQGGTYDAATHSVTWKITMYGKTYNTVYVNVTVNEGTEGTAFDNHLAYIQVDGAELYTNKVTNWVGKKTVTSVDGSDLSGKTVAAGDTVVYTIYTINSTSEDRYMQIYDNIPAGLTPISVSDGGTINGQEVTWNVLVGAGYLKTVTVTCTVNKGYSGKLIINTATVKGIYLTANVSDPGIYTGETIATGIAASKTPYVVVFSAISVTAVIVGGVLILRKKKR